MSVRRPDLGAAGKGELDNPVKPAGLGPRTRATLEARDPTVPGTPPLRSHEPPQSRGSGGAERGCDAAIVAERRSRQEEPERWMREDRRRAPFRYAEPVG